MRVPNKMQEATSEACRKSHCVKATAQENLHIQQMGSENARWKGTWTQAGVLWKAPLTQ